MFLSFEHDYCFSCVMGDTAVLDYLAPAKTETQLSLVSANGSESTPPSRYDSVTNKSSGLRHRGSANR